MKSAILLLNMGGPNNLSEVKTFLTNMFNDKAIISAPFFIRKFIAHSIVKNRLREATQNYKLLGGVSPIVGYTKELVKELSKDMSEDVFYIMRYTPPFAYDVLKDIKNYSSFFVIPLYPHFSSTTTQSSFDDLFKAAKKLKIDLEKFKIIDKFYSNTSYNKVITQRIKETLSGDNPQEFELVFSAHGLPQKIIDKGDPYMAHIKQNVYYARKELLKSGINFFATHLAYQSRVGSMEWIKPYLEDKLKSLKKRRVVIYPIAFLIDNSETEFELDIEYRDIAKELGFKDYRVAKAPNILIKETLKQLIRDKKC
ncbi:MAG: ferrochelatase [Sulfurospirillum sp.]